jgi:ribosomal protein S12 methylthiotransferase
LTEPAPPELLSVGFISLGCAKNLVDSQLMAGRLLAGGIRLAPAPESADIVIVNTCAFIEDARTESMEMILSACELKKTGPCRAVLVAGCLPQRYRGRIREALPDVDAFIGLDDLDRIGEIVRELEAGRHGIAEISETAERLFEPAAPVVFSSGANAWLKIAEGCNHRCAFCAIPAIRGRHRSRPPDRIVAEAQDLLGRGFRELDIISQDIMSYGSDLPGKSDLPALIRALGRLDGDFWIRLLYGYPSLITDDLLDAMAGTPQVCRYLDVPVQHSHPDILRAMRRGGTVEAVASMTGRIRARLPDAVIRTTCLVGFPGETEAHFQHLLDYCRDARFDHLGAFVYSPEEGTPAFEMDDTPALEVAEERFDRLMTQQRKIAAQRNRGLKGTPDIVLLEHPGGRTKPGRGRTRRQAPEVDGETRVTGLPANARRGDFFPIVYTGIREMDLLARVGKPATEPAPQDS